MRRDQARSQDGEDLLGDLGSRLRRRLRVRLGRALRLGVARGHALPTERDLPTAVGTEVVHLWRETKDLSQLVGECVFSMGRFFRGQAHFRWRDCLNEMQQCGAMALPIVGLISFLVGVTLAYTLFHRRPEDRVSSAELFTVPATGLAMTRT